MERKLFTSSTSSRASALAFVVGSGVLLGSCGATPGARPDDMSADHHRERAAEEDRKARKHEGHFDSAEQTTIRTAGNDAQSEFVYAPVVYNPTGVHLRIAGKHRRHAEDHRAAADALEKFEEQQCKSFPPETRKVCPLLGQLESVQDIDGGVRVQFAEDVNMDAATDHVLCHLAYGRTQGREGMSSCPLYVKGVAAERVGDTRNLDLTVEDEARVRELRARAATHVAPD